jgi:hypothetical protein
MSSTHDALPWPKSSPTRTDNLMTTASPWTNSPPPSMPSLTQGSMMSTQSFNNFFIKVTARSHDHQDLHAPNMGVHMSAIDTLTLKSMV